MSLPSDTPEDILDLGCGTGLLSKEFAMRGHHVVGVDPASAMLDVARRAPQPPNIEWVEARSETYESDRKFDLIIMTGHAFQVLLSDQQISQTLRTMADHLKPDGRIVFETRNPALDWDAIWSREYTMETDQGRVRAVRRITDATRTPEYLSFAWDYHFPDVTLTSDSTLRFPSASDITSFAKAMDLEISDIFGDWNGSGFDPVVSREMIFILEFKSK
ncbi:MAG: class I SAM-dependent methyltransferase, partial [Pseudomonadota bacterium]